MRSVEQMGNATSFLLEDKEKIFAVVELMDGGFQAFNVKVISLIREWITLSVRVRVRVSG